MAMKRSAIYVMVSVLREIVPNGSIRIALGLYECGMSKV